MQHALHIFIGEELVSFRDQFSSIFRSLNNDVPAPYFTVLSMTEAANDSYILKSDTAADIYDNATIEHKDARYALVNYFDAIYGRKVTVASPGNNSMVVEIWAKFYDDNVVAAIKMLVGALKDSRFNFIVEITGFTHDAVSCFIPNPSERLSPQVYKSNFDRNISQLRECRSALAALRLMANCNMQGLALNLKEKEMARVCAAYASLQCLSYRDIKIGNNGEPFESIGVSSLIFDKDYYNDYLLHKILIDKIVKEGIDDRQFNINGLAQKSNPLMNGTLAEITGLYNTQVTISDAQLALANDLTVSNLVAGIDPKVDAMIDRFKNSIDDLLKTGAINIFEREALAALILNNDCAMFDMSSVNANETTIDDLIGVAAGYFESLDPENETLAEVEYGDIKKLRGEMRNLADANRLRKQRLSQIDANKKIAEETESHIEGTYYRFGGEQYKINLRIDPEPLGLEYEPKHVNKSKVDLRSKFGDIRDQGSQGSCASFAVASVIEAMNKGKRYSPAFLYWNARNLKNATGKDCGASIYSVIKTASECGICKEQKMPYNAAVFNVAPGKDAETDALDCKIIESRSVKTELSHMKSALCEGFPVIVAVTLFNSFSDTRSGFVPLPTTDELAKKRIYGKHGLHAMVVCGFSDNEKVFIVRNSWGTNFGDKGYCYIPYSYAEKYFKQACIVTKISEEEEPVVETDLPRILDFDRNDSEIEAAILKNLIDESDVELEEKQIEVDNIKSIWTSNIAKLQNVTTQQDLVNQAQLRADIAISEEENRIDGLNESRSSKLKEFRHDQIKGTLISGLTSIVLWAAVIGGWSATKGTWPWYLGLSLAIVATLIFGGFIGQFAWSYKKYKQGLLDEIQKHAALVDQLKAIRTSYQIKGHIYGKVLREINNFKLDLQSRYSKRRRFNADIVKLHDRLSSEIESMSPNVPYPFMALLTNGDLDRYYNIWKEKMLSHTDLDKMYRSYCQIGDMNEVIANDKDLSGTITRGLRGFGMMAFVRGNNANQWQFLPNNDGMGAILPVLDNRATPFCPYQPAIGYIPPKYIFIDGITQADMNVMNRHFTQPPMPISKHPAGMITILNVVQYDIV